jgi:hypothetical protein
MYTSLFHGNDADSSQQVGAQWAESSVGEPCDDKLEGLGTARLKLKAKTKPRSPHVHTCDKCMHASTCWYPANTDP